MHPLLAFHSSFHPFLRLYIFDVKKKMYNMHLWCKCIVKKKMHTPLVKKRTIQSHPSQRILSLRSTTTATPPLHFPQVHLLHQRCCSSRFAPFVALCSAPAVQSATNEGWDQRRGVLHTVCILLRPCRLHV